MRKEAEVFTNKDKGVSIPEQILGLLNKAGEQLPELGIFIKESGKTVFSVKGGPFVGNHPPEITIGGINFRKEIDEEGNVKFLLTDDTFEQSGGFVIENGRIERVLRLGVSVTDLEQRLNMTEVLLTKFLKCPKFFTLPLAA